MSVAKQTDALGHARPYSGLPSTLGVNAQLAPPSLDLRTVPRSPDAKQTLALGQRTWVSALSNGVAAFDHVAPEFVVSLIWPPSPTSTHEVALVHAIEIMSPFDWNHDLPPLVVL